MHREISRRVQEEWGHLVGNNGMAAREITSRYPVEMDNNGSAVGEAVN